MTGRERFRETMRYGCPDHVPYFEEGIRDDVLEQWRQQGLAKDTDLYQMFRLDRHELLPVNLEPRPALTTWPTTLGELDSLRRCLDPTDAGRVPDDWPARVDAWRTRSHVVGLQVHRGFFLSMGVRDWTRFTEAVYQVMDAPVLVHAIMGIHAEFAVQLIERILNEVEVDFALFSEPIGGNEGPLLSPKTYEEFMLASYKPILDLLRRRGVQTIIYRTYANSRVLLPAVVKAGFDCLWAVEVNTEAMDYRSIRRQFGRDLRLIGGIDADTLLLDNEAIRREVIGKVPPFMAEGGIIPMADGRVRANVPFERYACYRRLLAQVTQA